ncbi:hypothetical protein ACSFB8_03990 [Enterococcus faecalis]
MADKIQYDPAKQAELKNLMNEVKEEFSSLIDEYKNVKEVVNSDFKGEAATALISTLEQKINDLTTEKNNWSAVIENADQVGKALIESDRNAKRIMDGLEPYRQAKGGKIL